MRFLNRRLALERLEDRAVPAVIGQLRVVNYNILQVPNEPAMTTVLQAINAETRASLTRNMDIVLLQEVNHAGTDDDTIRNILNAAPGSSGQYVTGPLSGSDGSIRQGVVYNDATVDFLGSTIISSTGPRDPIRYQFRPQGLDSSYDFYVFNSHYDAVDAPDRLNEAQNIRASADALGQGAEVLYAGDYNIDSSNEDMYDVTLLGAGNGQAFDPINTPGTWHESNALRGTHTQAPGPNFIAGGMDDRFDFILHTQEVGASGTAGDGTGLEYRAGSYGAFANNGTHPLNGNINQGTGASSTVLTALMAASDHLPVVSDYDIVSPDSTPPTVASVNRVGASPTNAASVQWAVTFSESVTGVDATDFALAVSGVTGTSISSVTGSGASYTVTANTGSGSGTLGLNVVDDDTVRDLVNLPLAGGFTGQVYAIDKAAPTVTITDNVGGGPVTVGAVITYTATFSEAVTGVEAGDFSNFGGATGTFANFTAVNATTYTIQYTTTGAGTAILRISNAGAVIRDAATNALATPTNDDTTITVNAAVTTFQVTAFTPTHSGFAVDFNRPLGPADLNLYDSAAGALGPADVTLTGPGGAVRGTLVVAPSLTRATFVATGGVLASGAYTATLRSAANGFEDGSSEALDGDANGTAGGDYTGVFSVNSTARVVSVPDFARGAGQPVDVPATATGLPLRVSDAAGVTGVEADLIFDAGLLTMPTGTFPGGPFGGTLTVTAIAGGVHLSVTGLTGATGANAAVANLGATVPAAAPYASKQSLNLRNVTVNGGAIAARGDDAVHVAAYLGDTTGNRALSAQDAALASQVGVSLGTGFTAYQNADPVVIADVTGNGVLSAQDAAFISQKSTGLTRPEIPNIPTIAPPPAGGPDPILFVGRTYRGGRPANLGAVRAGRTVRVPISVHVTEPAGVSVARTVASLRFDPRAFSFVGAADGALGLGVTWARAGSTVTVTGQTDVGPDLAFGDTETVFWLTLRVRPTARPGRSAINLLADGGRTAMADNLGRTLVLIPAPTDRIDDRDGAFRVSSVRNAR